MASNDQFKYNAAKRLKQIEDAHKAAENSTLRFPGENITFPPKEMVKFTQEEMDRIANEIDNLSRCPGCNERLTQRFIGYRELCYDCERKKKVDEKNTWLLSRKDLSIEERIAAIESWMYDHSKQEHYQNFVMR